MAGPYEGNIVKFLGQGALAARPAAPNLHPSAIGLYWATDATTGSELSVWAGGAWSQALADRAVNMTASEALAAGDFVNIHASAGAKIRKANATDDTKPVNGFVPAAIANTATGAMLKAGATISGLAGLTAGAIHYLATAAGTITDTQPAGAGNLVQEVGLAISATQLLFNPSRGITL
jgi:hypothetical protein